MKKIDSKKLFDHIIQILIIASLSFLMDFIIVWLSDDQSIWLGEAIEVVGSIVFGPTIGGIGAFLNCVITDFILNDSFDYIFVDILETVAVVVVGMVYRSLTKDEDKFGFREIVTFNFIQLLANISILYLSTAPVALLLFDPIVNDWSREEVLSSMTYLGDNAFSACVSTGIIGTVLLAACVNIRKRYKEYGSVSAVIHSFLKLDFLRKNYRSRALEYSFGLIFAIALTMTDGVISGQVLGSDALAASSLVFPLVSFSTFISTFLKSGCSNLTAIARGDHDYDKSNRLFTLGLTATLVLGVLQCVIFYLSKGLYFSYYSTTQSISFFANDYYNYYIFVPPFMAVALFLDDMVSADGDDMLSYAGYLVSFFVNVGASILLSRTLGMRGLALGTMLSYICYLLVVSIHFLKKNNTYRLQFWFSISDLYNFAKNSLKSNTSGLCMAMVSAAFTKAIITFCGSEYLIGNTVLCAMLEIYEMINGPSEAAEFMLATYWGEKNSEGVKALFKEAISFCIFAGMVVTFVLILFPRIVLWLYAIEDTPIRPELIKCIRFSSVGITAASIGGFLNDYYGNTEKPSWSVLMIVFRTALFPILFCVTFCINGGIVAMGRGMLLAQIFSICIFFCFVLILRGLDSIPFMIDSPDCDKVYMNLFEYTPDELGRISEWIGVKMDEYGIERQKIEELELIVRDLCNKTIEANGNNKVMGECVLRFIDEPEIIIKDDGKLFSPEISDERISYNVLLSCNSCVIKV